MDTRGALEALSREQLIELLDIYAKNWLAMDVVWFQCEYVDGKLIYTMEVCRVQAARERKGMPFHPCKGVGVIEYGGFAREIDRRIQCACLSCYPEVTDDTCCCKWAFSIPE